MATRGIRGAITVAADTPEMILQATRRVLQEIMRQNDGMTAEDIASAVFTLTGDLCAAYPAQAAREMGWDAVPMICAREVPVPGSLERVVRVLLHWNTDRPQSEMKHVYLGEATRLRPDLFLAQPTR